MADASTRVSDPVTRLPPAPPRGQTPTIAIMDGWLVVNATVRSKARANALIAMLNTVKDVLPDAEPTEEGAKTDEGGAPNV